MALSLTYSQITELNNRAWQNILNGNPSEGVEILNVVLNHHDSIGEFCNRGIAYLILQKYSEATADFITARNLRPAYRSIPFVGVSLWLDGKQEEACSDWLFEIEERRIRKLFYADAAGGVEPPALLWWAAVCMKRGDYKKIAELEMKRRLRTVQAQTNWPGAVAAFLVGKITIEQLLEEAEHKYSLVRTNRLCQASFYIAAYYNNQGNIPAVRYFLGECTDNPSITQCEFHLAKRLLEDMSGISDLSQKKEL